MGLYWGWRWYISPLRAFCVTYINMLVSKPWPTQCEPENERYFLAMLNASRYDSRWVCKGLVCFGDVKFMLFVSFFFFFFFFFFKFLSRFCSRWVFNANAVSDGIWAVEFLCR